MLEDWGIDGSIKKGGVMILNPKEVNMTKKEQLKQAFTREVKELIDKHDSTLADNTNVEVKDTVNTLLKEVTIRTNL